MRGWNDEDLHLARGLLGLRRDGMMEKASIVSIWKYIDVGNA